jgi:protein-S-isoprenylcysteine O-methyltransferase
VTAGHNFTHLIQTSRRANHELVTWGPYRWVRHPGYAGWLIWAVGTQLLLCNPLCLVGFAAAAIRFFRSRAQYEDQLLAEFFGEQHARYRAVIPSGIPFVP